MKMRTLLPIFTVIAFACSSGTVDLLAPKVELEQLSDESELYVVRGPVTVRYQVRVSNPSSEPVTLRQLDLRTFGDSPYQLRQGVQFFKQTVQPQEYASFEIGVFGATIRTSLGETEPVTIRGIATFEIGARTKQIVFTQTVNQPRRRDRN